jgi:phage FluMu protein gp41
VAIVLLIIGFSQTSTFREILREQALNAVNSSIAGKLDITAIDGTIFTSLILRGISLTYEQDTIASVSKIDLRISPMQILLKKIYVRSVEITGVDFRLVEHCKGFSFGRR